MFLSLLLVTFLVALAVSALAVRLFRPSLDGILKRIITDAISTAWLKYLTFAIYVVGISKGVRVYDLERYVNPERWGTDPGGLPLTRTANPWGRSGARRAG